MNLNDGLRELFREIPAQALVANDRSEKQFSDGLLFACTQGTAAQAWTVSLYAALVQTGRDELVKLPRFQAALSCRAQQHRPSRPAHQPVSARPQAARSIANHHPQPYSGSLKTK